VGLLDYLRTQPEIKLACDVKVLQLIQQLLSGNKTRLDEITYLIAQDPALTYFLLGKYFSEKETLQSIDINLIVLKIGFQEITSVVDHAVEVTAQNANILKGDLFNFYNYIRKRSIKLGVVSRIIAESSNPQYAGECQIFSLLSDLGILWLILNCPEEFLRFLKLNNFKLKNYLFPKYFRVSKEQLVKELLLKIGLPPDLGKLYEKNEADNYKELTLKLVLSTSEELIKAYEQNHLHKYSSADTLPLSSSFRLLSLQEKTYSKVFERVKTFLTTKMLLADIRKNSALHEKSGEEENHQDYLDSSVVTKRDVLVNLVKKSKSVSDLIDDLLDSLIQQDLFSRTALIKVNLESLSLEVIKSTGKDFSEKDFKINLSDAFLLKLPKIKSSTVSDRLGEILGCQTYGVMPILTGDEFYLIYADRDGQPIGLEPRRIFKLIAEAVKEKLKILSEHSELN